MKSHSLYGGRLLVEFDEVAHVYTCNGERWANVSSAGDALDLGKSGAFAWWSVNEMWDALEPKIGQPLLRDDLCDARLAHNKRKDEAAGIGRIIHDFLDAHLRARLEFADEPPLPSDPRARLAAETLLKVEQEQRIIYHASEMVVASMQHKFIGTLDRKQWIASAHDVPCVKDWKSGGIRKSHRIQLAAYAMAWNEMHPNDLVWKRIIDKLPTDESQEYLSFDLCYRGMTDEESTRFDFNAFLYALWLKHQWDPIVEAHMPKDTSKKKDRTKGKKKAA